MVIVAQLIFFGKFISGKMPDENKGCHYPFTQRVWQLNGQTYNTVVI
jgi:hypothetical protein